MQSLRKIDHYSVFEINDVMDSLRKRYDIVRLVDVEECRILEITDGIIHYGSSCFSIWGRSNRCANCSSKRSCLTGCSMDKMEHLGHDREKIHSIPIYLTQANGEREMCVIECVLYGGTEDDGFVETEPAEYLNTHDMLTRLYTQELLLREIREYLSSNPDTEYLLLMSNIRNYALVNKLFGTEIANQLLTGTADILRSECTEEEVYGRYRDDRFVLLIRKDKFREELFREHFQRLERLIDSPVFSVQIKLGIYEITTRNMPVTAMLERAGVAVDSVRDAMDESFGWYKHGMMEQIVKSHRIVADFEKALYNGEFQIYLQPQVVGDGKIYGAEALVRWIKPDGTMLPPGDFLPVLQQSELLSNLDVHVWEQAVRLLRKWTDSDLKDISVSVNIDPTDFYHLDVPDVLGNLCRRYDVDPQRLRVEITESALFGGENDAVTHKDDIVKQLHEAGFLVEIDDFGKGFSSLSMLKDVHADVLKIDMGFVSGESNRHRGGIILTSVIEMAKNLRMDVITEGVETRETVDELKAIGCNCFQGYYFSRPIPVDLFENLATENRRTH